MAETNAAHFREFFQINPTRGANLLRLVSADGTNRLTRACVLALTDEQFNSLICRLVERKARERAAYDRRDERTVSDSEALAELGIPVQEITLEKAADGPPMLMDGVV